MIARSNKIKRIASEAADASLTAFHRAGKHDRTYPTSSLNHSSEIISSRSITHCIKDAGPAACITLSRHCVANLCRHGPEALLSMHPVGNAASIAKSPAFTIASVFSLNEGLSLYGYEIRAKSGRGEEPRARSLAYK